MSFKKIFKISIFLAMVLVLSILMTGKVAAGTFGSETELTSTSTFTAFDGWITGTKYYLPVDAEIQSISAWLKFAENGLTRAGIYDNSDNLVATTTIYENTSGLTGDVLINFTFAENPVLDIGYYWLVVYAYDTDTLSYLATSTSGGTYQFEMEQEDLIFPETFGQSYQYAEETFIFATYSETSGTWITLSSDLPASIISFAADLFTDLNTLIVLAIGIPVAFWVSDKIIGLVIKDKGKY